MTFLRPDSAIEEWLEREAGQWRMLSENEYKLLVGRWKEFFWDTIERQAPSTKGDQAIRRLESLLPASVFVFNGVRVPAVANVGSGACAYQVMELHGLDRRLANHAEVILASEDMSWSCVFTHEAGMLAWEALYVRNNESE